MGPTRQLLSSVGNPEGHFPSIHVGGTNGKGTTAALIAETLEGRGFRVGLYTSPHLVHVSERILVDGIPIGEEAFVSWGEALEPAAQSSCASFFEIVTAIAMSHFAASGVDVAVVEVGLGGRLDSTNVIDPVLSVITNVDLDHTEYLGDTLEDIAREKAGIAKPDRPLIIGEPRAAWAERLAELGREAGAVPTVVPPGEEYDGPLGPSGTAQRRNARVAEIALAHLPDPFRPDQDEIRRGFRSLRIPGRFDNRGSWIFDVAHNRTAVDALVEYLSDLVPPRPLHALVGIMKDKDWQTMLRRVTDVVDRVWLTKPPSAPPARCWDPAEAHAALGRDRVSVEEDFDLALKAVQEGAASVLVTGSFHTVGDAMNRLPGLRPHG